MGEQEVGPTQRGRTGGGRPARASVQAGVEAHGLLPTTTTSTAAASAPAGPAPHVHHRRQRVEPRALQVGDDALGVGAPQLHARAGQQRGRRLPGAVDELHGQLRQLGAPAGPRQGRAAARSQPRPGQASRARVCSRAAGRRVRQGRAAAGTRAPPTSAARSRPLGRQPWRQRPGASQSSTGPCPSGRRSAGGAVQCGAWRGAVRCVSGRHCGLRAAHRPAGGAPAVGGRALAAPDPRLGRAGPGQLRPPPSRPQRPPGGPTCHIMALMAVSASHSVSWNHSSPCRQSAFMYSTRKPATMWRT